MKILLVEDDQRTADFIIKGLKQEGYKVEHIDNGQVAYDSLQYEHYDAAVMSGYSFGISATLVQRKI